MHQTSVTVQIVNFIIKLFSSVLIVISSLTLALFQIQAFMYGWMTFYHQGHEVAKDCKPYMTDLQIRVQNVRKYFCKNFAKVFNLLIFSDP